MDAEDGEAAAAVVFVVAAAVAAVVAAVAAVAVAAAAAVQTLVAEVLLPVANPSCQISSCKLLITLKLQTAQ